MCNPILEEFFMSQRSPEYDRTPKPTVSDDRRKSAQQPAGDPAAVAEPRLDDANLKVDLADSSDRSVDQNASAPLTDSELHSAIVQALAADPNVDDADIEVLVYEKGVMLNGTVPSRAMLQAAERCVRAVRGVKGVTNNMSPLMGGKIKFTGSAGQHPSASI
jgi:hypothetical protein